uniref:CSON008612 protein n=1 Tax=Culicoides sonorensis TaxID=179676 RepID=A0A336KPH0_CULSO
MDLFKKILGLDEKDTETSRQSNQTDNKNKSPFTKENEPGHTGKPSAWFEDFDNFDNKTFGFRVFTNPGEMQKHFEEQMEEMIRMLEEDNKNGMKNFDNFNEELFKLKPGIKKHIEDFHSAQQRATDTDLDDKAYSEQLKTLLDRIAPEKSQITSVKANTKEKRTEEQQIMDYIHGTVQVDPPVATRPRSTPIRRPNAHQVVPPQHGIFDGNSPRVFGQSIISQTIRKPDGSYETKRTVRDSNGEVKTTIIRSENGNVQKITTYSDDKGNSLFPPGMNTLKKDPHESNEDPIVEIDRTMYLNKDGYTMPRNLF